MNDLETMTLAAAKAVDAKTSKLARDAVAVGTHAVDFLLRIRGTFRVGEDYEQRLVAKADPFALLAVALDKLNGVTIESIVKEAQEADPGEVRAIKAKTAQAVEALKAPTLSVCRGKVTTDLEFEVVEEV